MARDEFVSDLATKLHAVAPELPREKIVEFIGQIRRDWGGREVYISQRDWSIRSQRIEQAMACGGSRQAIAKRAGCSLNTLHRYLQRVRSGAISGATGVRDAPDVG